MHRSPTIAPAQAHPATCAPPLLSSHERGWRGILVEERRQRPHEHEVAAWAEHRVVLVLKRGPGRVRQEIGGQEFDGSKAVGTLSILPAGASGHCSCEAHAEVLHIRLDPGFVSGVAQEMFGSSRFQFATRLCVHDEPMRQIALLLRDEMRSDSAGGAFLAESLGRSLVVYLLRFHARLHAQSKEPVCELCGGLSDRALRRVRELVRENLASALSLDELAQSAGVSRFHFARSFKKSTGVTPHQFVLSQRVERAKQLLLEGDLPLREIAQSTGFADQSHLTRQFRRLTGATPRAFQAPQAPQVLAGDKPEQESSKNTL